MDTQRYTEVIHLRITKKEKDNLRFQSEIAGQSVSNLVRNKIQNIKIVPKVEKILINELRRQGGLLKNNFQTVKNSELNNYEKEQCSTQMKQTLNEIQNLINKISSGYEVKK